jgi:hypothetical protein
MNPTNRLKKLKGRSFEELRVRASQKFSVLAERKGWSGGLPDDARFMTLIQSRGRSAAELLNHFRGRIEETFFASFADQPAIVEELQRRFPKHVDHLIVQARRMEEGRFDLLGLRDLFFGSPVDWHLEPLSGKRSPLVHWSEIGELDAGITGDKKITWELNRHQHFITLGRAYWITRDERHAELFVSHLVSWMDSNPPTLGLNWLSSLEVAFRSISWLWAFAFFKNSPQLTPDIFLRFLKYLYLHARHLEKYLSTYSSPNTHLTGEALGLFYLGSLLPEFRDASRWRNTAQNILLEQLPRHVQPDGVYFEQSSYYHRYTVDFYTHFFILAQQAGETYAPVIAEHLQKLLDHLMYITRPDGTSPIFGDDDGGKLLRFDCPRPNDFRAALSTGAALFNRPDYKFVAGEVAEETMWLLGTSGPAAFDSIQSKEPNQQSIAFESGGYYVMRDGWTPTANFLLFDCGPHGFSNCGHAHADALSFELAANGCTLLVDPGTYTYTGNSEMRDWFRGSSAHNTLTLDHESSSVPHGPFSWQSIAKCERHAWITQKRFDYVAASHDGYERLPNAATHTRSILFLKNDYWVIIDRVVSRGDHLLELGFHFDPRVAPLHSHNNGVQVVSENGHTTRLELMTFAKSGEWRREQGWVSSCYGEKEKAPLFFFSVWMKGFEELVTFLLPQVTGLKERPTVREIEALEGRAFEIDFEDKRDLLMLRGLPGETAGPAETAKLSSDFGLTWARFATPRARTPEELVLIGGQTLQLEGRDILKSGKRIDYLVLSTLGDQVHVETAQDDVATDELESLFSNLR